MKLCCKTVNVINCSITREKRKSLLILQMNIYLTILNSYLKKDFKIKLKNVVLSDMFISA